MFPALAVYGALGVATCIISLLFYRLKKTRSLRSYHQQPISTKNIVKCQGQSAVVVLPISGPYNREQQFRVWDSVLGQQTLLKQVKFVFVVESKKDPAWAYIEEYLTEKHYASALSGEECEMTPGRTV